ncbi:MAG: hypothetical protein D6768_15930 [Chloroflexi bacterium]|nr:MAG: hypothetical protein D6768_15930 [Chloroflexota bacterium]
MSGYKTTTEEIIQWHREFKLTRKAWVKWLVQNAEKYASTEDAWQAFRDESRQLSRASFSAAK